MELVLDDHSLVCASNTCALQVLVHSLLGCHGARLWQRRECIGSWQAKWRTASWHDISSVWRLTATRNAAEMRSVCGLFQRVTLGLKKMLTEEDADWWM